MAKGYDRKVRERNRAGPKMPLGDSTLIRWSQEILVRSFIERYRHWDVAPRYVG